jgi:hypothetical protein
VTSRLGTDAKIVNLFLQCTPPLLSLSMHCILILSFQGLKPSYISASISCTFRYLLFFTISAFHYLPLSSTVSSILHFCLPSLSSAFHFLPLSLLVSPSCTILCLPLFFALNYPCLPLSSAFHFLPLSCTRTSILYYSLPSTILCLTLSLSSTILRLRLPSTVLYSYSILYYPLPSTFLCLSLSLSYTILSLPLPSALLYRISLSSAFHYLPSTTVLCLPPTSELLYTTLRLLLASSAFHFSSRYFSPSYPPPLRYPPSSFSLPLIFPHSLPSTFH